MRHNIRRYSPKKHFGKATKRRRPINFEKQNLYSLDRRIIEKKVGRSMRIFRKFRNEKDPMENNKIIMKFFRLKFYVIAILGNIGEMLLYFEKWFYPKKGLSYMIANAMVENTYITARRRT